MKTKKKPGESGERKLPPAISPDAREKQLIALSVDLVEKRLREGTATSQEIVHFLKLGSMREKLEREKLEHENELLRAKKEALESGKRIEELYSGALRAMQGYRYEGVTEDDPEV